MQPIDENTPGAVEVTTWHLEITEPALIPAPTPPRLDAEIVVAERMTVSFARWLYDYVGEPWHWIDRNVFDDDRWETTILAPGY
ncbi:MAG: N-acetyltransferase, partial [Actinomycetota bacterium]|nr:N-acetyltransferase [Actinomycetota bacterium]